MTNKIYENYAKIRDEMGYTDYRVCKETGVSSATITSWKQDKYTPKDEKLQKIADLFEVPLSILKTGSYETDQGYYVNGETKQLLEDLRSKRELKGLLDASRDLDTDSVLKLTELVKSMKKGD